MPPDLATGLVLGLLIGFPLGRGWAETRRARHDMRHIWVTRKNYRRKR